MIFTNIRLIKRLCPPYLAFYSRNYRMPPNLVSYLDNYCKDYNNHDSSLVNSFDQLKGKLAEHAELETMKEKTSDKELAEMAAIDMDDVSDNIDELVDEISLQLGEERARNFIYNFLWLPSSVPVGSCSCNLTELVLFSINPTSTHLEK